LIDDLDRGIVSDLARTSSGSDTSALLSQLAGEPARWQVSNR
jgi:hypothetical protein